ncbi:hypothetical protein J3Q64DRAFT_1752680 [Phycomyces blakesleeanus]|uniref:EamA domain-containing protein n=1 Tax=Phycomyces blakesleeanus TaxID=4837 RepID=A0ABR3AWX5_PHYBL
MSIMPLRFIKMFGHDRLYIIFHQLLFLLTGLFTTLGIQWLFYKGAATGDSYLVQLAQYLGMVMVGLLIPFMVRNRSKGYSSVPDDAVNEAEDIQMNPMHPEEREKLGHVEGPVPHRSIMKLAVLDVVANFCVTLGFAVIGSGMYQVIYSSVVIWCAILAYFFMGRSLGRLQWLAILGVSAGLAICSLGSSDNKKQASTANTTILMFGTLMTLGGTFFYSCVYVYSDHILSKHVPPPLAARVCCYTGMYTSVLSLVWVAIYTIPRFDKLIHIDPTVPIWQVFGMYVLVVIANGTHAWNYYELIDRTGSVATGILQGLRAVLVYVISHAWYCSTDSAQCFTVHKGFGSLLVISCVLLFTLGGKSGEKAGH